MPPFEPADTPRGEVTISSVRAVDSARPPASVASLLLAPQRL
jgi:hypothetical protein